MHAAENSFPAPERIPVVLERVAGESREELPPVDGAVLRLMHVPKNSSDEHDSLAGRLRLPIHGGVLEMASALDAPH